MAFVYRIIYCEHVCFHFFYFQTKSVGEIGTNWDTFIIYRPGADDNRVGDSKKVFSLGLIFIIVIRTFNK